MTDALAHAVTVPQPRAWAIAAGLCPVLMSDTGPDMRHEGALIGIHASRHRPEAADFATTAEALGERAWDLDERKFTLGALIGVGSGAVAEGEGRMSERIVVESGESIGAAVQRAQVRARLSGLPVDFDFNGVPVTVRAGDSASTSIDLWAARREAIVRGWRP
jgi:hypothetical protein